MHDPLRDAYGDLWRQSLLEARERVLGAADLATFSGLAEYDLRPVEFAREVLGHRTWAASRATMRALVKHRRVLISSCRKSSKTHTAAQIVPAFVCTAPTICVTTAGVYTQVRDVLWAKVRANMTRARRRLPGTLGVTSLRIAPDWFAIGISTNKPGNIQGFHAAVTLPEGYEEDEAVQVDPKAQAADVRRAAMPADEQIEKALDTWQDTGPVTRLLLILDEMPEIKAEILDTLEGSMMGSNVYALGQGNPTLSPDSSHPFMRALQPGSGWWRIHIAGEEPPEEQHPDELFDQCFHGVPPEIMAPEWREQRARAWGKDSALYMAHVLGLPAAADRERQFIPWRVLRDQFSRELKDDGRVTSRHIGWDVAASESGDFNVAQLWVCGQLVEEVQWRSADTVVSAEKVLELAHRWGAEGRAVPSRNIHVDNTGVGKGPVDYLRSKGVVVDAVDFGAEPHYEWRRLVGDQTFTTRKAELLWVLRRALQEGIAALPRRFEDTVRQAQWYTYEEVPRAAGTALKVVESKDDLKEAYGRSPDNLEAALLAWSRGTQKPGFKTIRDLRQISRLLR